MVAGLKVAVTPDGRPLKERATALLNPPETAVVMVEVARSLLALSGVRLV